MLHQIIRSASAFFAAAWMTIGSALLSATAGHAGSTDLLAGFEPARAGEARRDVLPPTRDTRAYRETVFGNCDLPNPDAAGQCKFTFTKVGANRLLEVSNISCFDSQNVAKGYILTTNGAYSQAIDAIVAVIATVEHVSVANASGPFFFSGGEQLFMFGLGEEGGTNFCTIYGWLSRTD